MFVSMAGEAGAARQLAGLLRGGGEDLAAQRVARLVADVCAASEPADAVRLCGDLRDSVLELVEDGTVTPAEARLLCRDIDLALAVSLERLRSPVRMLDALERAVGERSVRNIPQLVLEGALSADSAALLSTEGGVLAVRAFAGLPLPAEATGPQSVAARALAAGDAQEAHDVEEARCVLALPLYVESESSAILRVSSRSVWQFGADERAFLRGIGHRAASLVAGENPRSRLRHALRTFESLVEASPLPIVAIDADAMVQIWNHAAEELFGWQRGEVMGKPLPVVPPDLLEEARAIEEDVRAGRTVRNREVRWARRDGTRVDLALSVAPLRDPAGSFSGAISILMDISDRKHREYEAERTARFREHLLGIVSHDLRNPLTAIVTSAQLLLRYGELPDRQGRVVGRIATSADRMARMIDDLLDFARTRLGGELPIHLRRIDLRQICEQTIEELEFAYTRRVNLEAEGDLWGDWDPDRIAQVISNLAGNALQHSEGDVSVLLHGERDVVVFQTVNGGPPIPREVLPHIFEPGRRGDARSGGLGLGLFIVQQIVLAHGGNIEVTSSEAAGTVFIVVLPRKGRQGPSLPQKA